MEWVVVIEYLWIIVQNRGVKDTTTGIKGDRTDVGTGSWSGQYLLSNFDHCSRHSSTFDAFLIVIEKLHIYRLHNGKY